MYQEDDEALIGRIRSYNWQKRKQTHSGGTGYWLGEDGEIIEASVINEADTARAYPLATQEQIRESEQLLGFSLPPLLCSLYLQVGNGGFGPGYGIIGAVGGYSLEDGFGKDIAHGYLDRIQGHSIIHLDDYEMRTWTQRYRELEKLPSDEVVGWDYKPLELSRYKIKPEREQQYLYEIPQTVWPCGLLPLCYWGCGICSYIDASTEYIFQGTASSRRQHYLLVYSSASLKEWLERWMAGESLQLL